MEQDEQLAAFCAALPELSAVAARQGLTELLADVLAKVRAGEPVATQLARLGVPTDALRHGGFGGVAFSALTDRPAGEVYVCPTGSCTRRVRREPGGPLPTQRCWLRGAPLLRRPA